MSPLLWSGRASLHPKSPGALSWNTVPSDSSRKGVSVFIPKSLWLLTLKDDFLEAKSPEDNWESL